VVLGSWDRAAHVYNTQTGAQIGTLVHNERVYSVKYSTDGHTIITGCGDSTVRLWDAASLAPKTLPLRAPGPVFLVFMTAANDRVTALTGKGLSCVAASSRGHCQW